MKGYLKDALIAYLMETDVDKIDSAVLAKFVELHQMIGGRADNYPDYFVVMESNNINRKFLYGMRHRDFVSMYNGQTNWLWWISRKDADRILAESLGDNDFVISNLFYGTSFGVTADYFQKHYIIKPFNR